MLNIKRSYNKSKDLNMSFKEVTVYFEDGQIITLRNITSLEFKKITTGLEKQECPPQYFGKSLVSVSHDTIGWKWQLKNSHFFKKNAYVVLGALYAKSSFIPPIGDHKEKNGNIYRNNNVNILNISNRRSTIMDNLAFKLEQEQETSQKNRIFQSVNSFTDCASKYAEFFSLSKAEEARMFHICKKLDEQKENAFILTPPELSTITKIELGPLIDLFNIPMFQDFLNKGVLPTIKAQIRKLSAASSDDENALKKLGILTKIAAEIENAIPSTQIVLMDIREKVPDYD